MKEDDLHTNGDETQFPVNQDLEQQNPVEQMTEDELIDAVAARVLEKYRAAFEELAK